MQLSEHFSLSELTCTSQPFANDPGPVQVANLKALCQHILEPVRAQFGQPVRVNSAYRSAKVNAAVGSKPTSQHTRGQAADIEIAGLSNATLAAWIRDNLAFDQLILENHQAGVANSGWVHVAWSAAARRGGSKGINSVLTMTLRSHGAVYTSGLTA